VMAATSLVKEQPNLSEHDVRIGLEGNLCRCTGYHNIVKAVSVCASTMAESGSAANESAVTAGSVA